MDPRSPKTSKEIKGTWFYFDIQLTFCNIFKVPLRKYCLGARHLTLHDTHLLRYWVKKTHETLPCHQFRRTVGVEEFPSQNLFRYQQKKRVMRRPRQFKNFLRNRELNLTTNFCFKGLYIQITSTRKVKISVNNFPLLKIKKGEIYTT